MFNWKTITLALLAASEIQFVNAYVPSNIILPSAIGASIVKIVAEANNPASNVKAVEPQSKWRPRGHCWFCDASGLSSEEAVTTALMTNAAGADLNEHFEQGEGGHKELMEVINSNHNTRDQPEERPRPGWKLSPPTKRDGQGMKGVAGFPQRPCESNCCKIHGAENCPGVEDRDFDPLPVTKYVKRQMRCPLNPPSCRAIQILGLTPEYAVDLATWQSIGAFATEASAQDVMSPIPTHVEPSSKAVAEGAILPVVPPPSSQIKHDSSQAPHEAIGSNTQN